MRLKKMLLRMPHLSKSKTLWLESRQTNKQTNKFLLNTEAFLNLRVYSIDLFSANLLMYNNAQVIISQYDGICGKSGDLTPKWLPPQCEGRRSSRPSIVQGSTPHTAQASL